MTTKAEAASVTTNELLRRGKRDQRGPCGVAETLSLLSPADRKVIEDAMGSSNARLRTGAKDWLEEKGIPYPTGAALGAHFAKKECRCHG